MTLVGACATPPEQTHPLLENITESVYASGTVKSKDQYQVYSTVGGTVLEILVAAGDIIKKGQPLMRVRNVVSALNTDNARLAASHADLEANAAKLREAQVSIDVAFVKMKNDSLLLVRQQTLHAQNVGTRVELEQRELAYRSSLASYKVAVLNYNDLKRDLEFLSAQSKKNLQITEALAGDYVINARSDGRIYKIFPKPGEFVSTLTPVAVIGDASTFYLELQVDEYDISRIQMGQQVFFTMDSYKGKVFEGRIEKIEPLMDQASRSFTVKAEIVASPPQLFANLSLEANIVIRAKEKVLTIPRSYLIGDSIVMTGKREQRKVRIGIKDFQKAEVIDGLTEKDVIYKITP